MEWWQLSCQVSHGWCWIRAAVIVKFKESIQKTDCGLNVLSCHVLSRMEGGEGCTCCGAVAHDEQTNDKSSYFCCFIEKAYEAWKLGVRMFLDCASKKTSRKVCSFYYYDASSNFLCSFLWFNLGKGLDLMEYCRAPVGNNESDVAILTLRSAEQATASCSVRMSYPS